MNPSQLADIEAIKQLKARYFRCMDSRARASLRRARFSFCLNTARSLFFFYSEKAFSPVRFLWTLKPWEFMRQDTGLQCNH